MTFFNTIPDVQVNLSTTPRQPDSLSPVFAENIGPNEATVHSGALTMRGLDIISTPGQPNFFEAGIQFPASRFYYDPAQGNLLLQV